MTLTLLNVIYVLLAIAMTGFILVQRGAGAQAGSGFGAGASGTVFGSRGAGNFLTKSTAVLAALFFLLSLGMGIYVSRSGIVGEPAELGVMGDAPSEVPAPAAATDETPAASDVPAAAPAATGDAPVATDVPQPPEAAQAEAETPKDGPER